MTLSLKNVVIASKIALLGIGTAHAAGSSTHSAEASPPSAEPGASAAEFTFKQYDVVTGSAKRQTILTGFLLLVQHGELRKMPPESCTPVRVVRDVITEAISRSEIPAQDPDVANALVFGLVLQPALFKVYGQIDQPMTALAERLTEACWRTLSGLPE